MDFTPLLREAWRTAWRHRGWWLLGLLGGGVVGPLSLPSFGLPNNSRQATSSSAQLAAFEAQWRRGLDLGQATVLAWLNGHLTLVAVWSGVTLVIFLLVWYWSVAAQGALSWATTRLANGQDAPRTAARKAGRRLFGRYLCLWLIPFVLTVLVVAAEGWYLVQHLSERSLSGLIDALGSSGASPLLFVPELVWLPLSIWLALAKRAMAHEDVGPSVALRFSWDLLRANFGQAMLAWLVGFAVWWASLLAAMVGLAIVGTVAGVAVALFVAFLSTRVALAAGFVPYAIAGVALFVAAILFVVGVIDIFMWSYWSHVYLRLRARTVTFASVALG
jgi:hypothetical protein